MTANRSSRLVTVEELLSHLDDDRNEVVATSIDDLGGKIDDAVYDLLELSEDKREVMEGYLKEF